MLTALKITIYQTIRQTRINPIIFGKIDNASDYIGFITNVLIVLLFAAVLTFSFSEKIHSYLVPISKFYKLIYNFIICNLDSFQDFLVFNLF